MNRIFLIYTVLVLLFVSCNEDDSSDSIHVNNWTERSIDIDYLDTSLTFGSTYLSVYSSVYSYSEKRTTDLTATVSMRNLSKSDSVYILKAEYFDTHGNLIRTYFDHPIYLSPMETVEIVIHQSDTEGGTGANFVFDWAKTTGINDPFFEAVMISMSSQQGLSFSTHGVKL